MNLDGFTSKEIRLLYDAIEANIQEVKHQIKDTKAILAYKQIYSEDIEKGDMVINSHILDDNGNEIEKSPEEFLLDAEEWLKEYQEVQRKLDNYLKLIEESEK